MKAPELDEAVRRAVMGDPRFRTEDNDRIYPQKVMFNHYDQQLVIPIMEGTSADPRSEFHRYWNGWFKTIRLGSPTDSGPLLNAARMCGVRDPRARHWVGELTEREVNDLMELSLRHGPFVMAQLLDVMLPSQLYMLCVLNGIGEDVIKGMSKRRMARLLMHEFFPADELDDSAPEHPLDSGPSAARLAETWAEIRKEEARNPLADNSEEDEDRECDGESDRDAERIFQALNTELARLEMVHRAGQVNGETVAHCRDLVKQYADKVGAIRVRKS